MVANLVRGKRVDEAMSMLKLHAAKAARDASASCSARRSPTPTENEKVDVDELVVTKINVDSGPIAKRWMPRSMGRANRINSRTSPRHDRRRRAASKEQDTDGTENTSGRLPPRHHQDAGPRSGTRRRTTPSGFMRTCELKKFIKQKLEHAGVAVGRGRARREQGEDQHLHRAPGHRHRQARRGRRAAQEGSPGAHRRTRSSSTSRKSARPRPTRSSSPRTSRPSSSAASPSAAP